VEQLLELKKIISSFVMENYYIIKIQFNFGKKYKINLCGSTDLQINLYGIKMF
jgi:hypothetical protein